MGNEARRSFATAFVGRVHGLGNLCRHWWACWREKGQESLPSQNAALSAFDSLLADAIKGGFIVDSGRRLELLRHCFEHIWQPANQASIGTTGHPSTLCDDWLIESLYAASTRVLQDVAQPHKFTRVLSRHAPDELLLTGVTVFHELSALINHAYALFQLSRSRSSYKISLDLHICMVVLALAGLRAHMGDWQRTKLRPVFTLAGPIQRDLEEKTSALTHYIAELETAKAQLKRRNEAITQQDDRIRGLVSSNTELTRQIEHLRQELATLGTEPLQRAAAALTARLEGEQLLVLDLQQKLQELQPVCDARVRAAEAFVDKQNEHIQYLKRELRRAGVGFNENWGVGNQGCAA